MNRPRLFPPLALERAMAASAHLPRPADRPPGTLDGAELRRLVAAMIG